MFIERKITKISAGNRSAMIMEAIFFFSAFLSFASPERNYSRSAMGSSDILLFIPKVSPQMYAKFQNSEENGTLYSHKRPNFLHQITVYSI